MKLVIIGMWGNWQPALLWTKRFQDWNMSPYKDLYTQREYQRNWIKNRKSEWLSGKVCKSCGRASNLEIHHVDRDKKVSHRIWSWSQHRRDEELSKCVVLCHKCHLELSKRVFSSVNRGENHPRSKLSCLEISDIREKYSSGLFTQKTLEKMYGLSRGYVSLIVSGKRRKNDL